MRKAFILACLVLVQSAAYAQLPAYLPAAGLITWFPFTGNAVDSSGHGHDGTIHGLTSANDRYGNPGRAYYFNGTSDYIYVPPGTPGYDVSTDITASLTISAWVKSQNYSYTSQEQIYWRGDPTPAHDPHMLYFIGGEVKIRRDVDPGTISNEVGTSVSSLDTNYHLMTGTYDSVTSVMRIYLDGVLMNSATLPGLETYPTATMYNYIGAVDGGTWQFFYGTMDELGIWNRALTPCEVMALYYSIPNIITGQPVNDTVVSGGTATFTVAVLPTSTYQWQENSGTGFVNLTSTSPYSGVNTPTLTISPVTTAMTGRQYRCIPSSGTCLSDTSNGANLIVRPPTGTICTAQEDNYFDVMPNPSKGTFTLRGYLSDESPVSIGLTNLFGQVVYTEQVVPRDRVINHQIVITNAVPPGMYFLKIRSRNQDKVLYVVIEK